MVKSNPQFSIKAKVQKCEGKGRWHFINLDKKVSDKVRDLNTKKMAWGYVPIVATIGKTNWKTTLFPTKEKVYMLALNAEVRKKEEIETGEDDKSAG
jgi:hypothetical protein